MTFLGIAPLEGYIEKPCTYEDCLLEENKIKPAHEKMKINASTHTQTEIQTLNALYISLHRINFKT